MLMRAYVLVEYIRSFMETWQLYKEKTDCEHTWRSEATYQQIGQSFVNEIDLWSDLNNIAGGKNACDLRALFQRLWQEQPVIKRRKLCVLLKWTQLSGTGF